MTIMRLRVCRPTLHGDIECAAVALVFGGDLAAVTTCVSIHYFDDAHLVSVDLTERERKRWRWGGDVSGRNSNKLALEH